MIGKLLKYDLWQSGSKYLMTFIVMTGLFLTSAVVSMFNISFLNNILLAVNIIASIVFVFLYIIYSIKDFAVSMSGNGSYFTYMLPVSVNKLLLSKLITVIIWGAAVLGTLAVLWQGMNLTLLKKLGFSLFSLFELISQNKEIVFYTIIMGLIQYFGTVIIIAFSISLTSVPFFRNKGIGIPAGIVCYAVLNNVIGLIQVGLVFAVAFFQNNIHQIVGNNIPYEQIPAFMQSMSGVVASTYVILIPLFCYLTSLMYRKHRTI